MNDLIKQAKTNKILEGRLVKWWNENAFCGYLVDDIQGIIDSIQDSPYKSIGSMLAYHHEEANSDGFKNNYYKDFFDIVIMGK